jgi:hypothetical protein
MPIVRFGVTMSGKLYGFAPESENSAQFKKFRKEAESYCTESGDKVDIAIRYYIEQRSFGFTKLQATTLMVHKFSI